MRTRRWSTSYCGRFRALEIEAEAGAHARCRRAGRNRARATSNRRRAPTISNSRWTVSVPSTRKREIVVASGRHPQRSGHAQRHRWRRARRRAVGARGRAGYLREPPGAGPRGPLTLDALLATANDPVVTDQRRARTLSPESSDTARRKHRAPGRCAHAEPDRNPRTDGAPF